MNNIISELRKLELHNSFKPKIKILLNNTIYTINCQSMKIMQMQQEIKILKAEQDNYKEWYFNTVEQAESKAIKEFADKLRDKIDSYSLHVDCEGVETLNRLYRMIDSLVKEMTESEE